MTQEIPRLKLETRPGPAMPSACQAGGCGSAAAAPRTPLPDFSIVRVNGVEIEPEAIAHEMQHHPAIDGQSAWREAARALAIRELLLQEAHRLGIVGEAAPDPAGRMESEEDAVISALLEHEVEPERPGETECRRYYETRPERFRTADLFEVSHVLIEPEGDGPEAWSVSGRQTRAVIERVGDDPKAFAAAAREYSACPSAMQDGSLGQVRRGELVPQVREVIERMTPGQTYGRPVRSGFGWHALHLHRRIAGHTMPFETVAEKIADMLGARGWSVAAMRYVARLAERAQIEGVVVEPAPEPAAL